MNTFFALLQFFAPVVLIALTYVYQYKIDHSNQTPKAKRSLAKGGFVVSIFALIITAIFQFRDWKSSEDSNNELSNQLNNLLEKNAENTEAINSRYTETSDSIRSTYRITSDSMRDKIGFLQDAIISKDSNLLHLYSKLSSKSDFIQNSLYGDGYAFVTRGPSLVDSIVRVSFYIQNISDMPIYNFRMQIYNLDKLLAKVDKRSWSDQSFVWASDFNGSILYSIGPIDINPSETYRTDFIPENYYENCIAVITTRNGRFYEKILFWPDIDINKSLYNAYELYDNDLNLLKSQIPEYLEPYEDTLQTMIDKIDLKLFKSIRVINEDLWW